jgi:hypothetical protein
MVSFGIPNLAACCGHYFEFDMKTNYLFSLNSLLSNGSLKTELLIGLSKHEFFVSFSVFWKELESIV